MVADMFLNGYGAPGTGARGASITIQNQLKNNVKTIHNLKKTVQNHPKAIHNHPQPFKTNQNLSKPIKTIQMVFELF
jgi:hypothetical protein